MLKSSFIDSNDYYPVSVCNEFVDNEKRKNHIQSNNYSINTDISRNINNNELVYKVYQDPTVPSQSLYIESDKSFSNYYNKNDKIEHFDAVNSNLPSFNIAGNTVDTTTIIAGSLALLIIILVPLIASFAIKNKK